MRVSTKGRYALRMFLDLAERRESEEYISLGEVAERQNISKKYLEQIVPLFNKTGILKAGRGAQGGYKFAKTPDKVTVGDVLRLTEGTLAPVDCVDQDPIECTRSDECLTLPVWQGLFKVINEYLDSITLQDLLDQKHSNDALNYVI